MGEHDLSGQGELHRDTEVLCGGGITGRRKERCVRLPVVVGRERHQTTQSIVGHNGDLQGRVAGRGCRSLGGNIAGDIKK